MELPGDLLCFFALTERYAVVALPWCIGERGGCGVAHRLSYSPRINISLEWRDLEEEQPADTSEVVPELPDPIG
jgi:hypothetical protein